MNIFDLIINQPLANGIVFFYDLLGGNFGLAIIAFSLALRIILTPLTKPYMESMKKMRSFQADLEKIKKRHKDDRTKLAQAQADFYKEKGINPTAGCLPYLLQIVILIALFRLFINVLSPEVDTALKLNELMYEPLKFASGEVVNTQFFHMDIRHPDTISIPGLPFALPGVLLIAASLAQLLSAKMSQPFLEAQEKKAKKTPEKSDDMMAGMQTYMIYMFPAMTLIIGLNFPSGLAIYWLVFSLFQVYQSYQSTGWGGATPWIKKLKSFV